MPGFNYGGGVGDGTGWSKERGSEPAPGGGSHGNAGNNNGSSGSSNGMTDPVLSQALNKSVGDNMARGFGLDPKQFVSYFLREDGHVLAITSYSLGDAYGVDFGFPPPSPGNGGNGNNVNNSAGTPNATASYQGDVSAARVAALRQIIANNYALANSTQAGTRITKAKQATVDAKKELALIDYTIQGRAQQNTSVADAVKSTADFMAEITNRFGQQASELAQEFAEQAKGKTLRNVDEALAAFNNYKGSLGAKFSVADRNAIANALKSLDYTSYATQLAKYSKGFGYYGTATDVYATVQEIVKAIETDNWRPALVKIEALTAGKVATVAVAFTFGILTGTPVGVLAMGLMIALTSSLIDDALMNKINAKLGL
ncbi:alveicin A bacteriocin toxin [Pantoea vagans]|uniref:Alveicin A bacteriocin toxin n=1 Tax=Pantoea vagans TaxID=470934 RepID=A0ABY3LGD2_9GAMM|nr:colicin-like pore-forming protein [Pantoea sp. JKS000250]PXW18970.1 colicin pore forming domain-containing protein [Pantoea sp. JKS000250]TXL79037.1 alveicin A bacteriocin toxin [Pantoea vagans]